MLKNYSIKIAAAPFAVLIIHILVTLGGFYEKYWWMDMPLHFLGGIAIALGAYFLLQDFSARGKFKNEFKPLQIIILIGMVALAAVLWEFMEYGLDTLANTHLQADIFDTIKDLSMGLTGGGFCSVLITLKRK